MEKLQGFLLGTIFAYATVIAVVYVMLFIKHRRKKYYCDKNETEEKR